MEQEIIKTKAKIISKEIKRQLALEDARQAIHGEIFQYKKTMIALYYYAKATGNDEISVAVYLRGVTKVAMPYSLRCIIDNGKEVHRSFHQEYCESDKNFSEYNNVLTEVLDETLKVINKEKEEQKEGVTN